MKSGKSLVELAKTLEHIKKNGKDFIVPTQKLTMDDKAQLVFQNGKEQILKPTGYAHGQIAGYTNIPKQYYDRIMMENPQLLSKNVNHGFDVASQKSRRDGKPESRMVRTVDGNVRAVLSSSYRRLDSFDLCNEVLPVIADRGMEVISSEITDTRLYIKALSPKLTAEIQKGDVVQYGIVISNSDVGAGSVRVEPLIYRLVCTNGMISDTAMKKFHVGKNQAEENIMELLSEETLNLTDAAFWATVRDVTLSSLRPEIFEREVNRIRAAANQKITNFNVPEVVELAMKATGTSGENVKDTMIGYLANGADGAGLTRWGLANAYTYAAHKDEKMGYDQSIELERAGAKVLTLSEQQWKRVANE
jgi:hypothetical protein